MKSRFYYSKGGSEVHGPVEESELWGMLRAGVLPDTIQICREGTEEWSGVSLPSQVPPPPPPSGPASSIMVIPTEIGATVVQSLPKTDEEKDDRVTEIINTYGIGAFGAMMIPLPGVDIGATMAVWGAMIRDIAKVYGHDVSLEDAKRLGSDLFKSVVLTSVAWFASAKVASSICKFIPFAGTVTAFVIDSVIASLGAKNITAMLGTAAALYYKSNRTMAPETMAAHVKNVVADPRAIKAALSLCTVGISIGDIGVGDLHRNS